MKVTNIISLQSIYDTTRGSRPLAKIWRQMITSSLDNLDANIVTRYNDLHLLDFVDIWA